MKRTKLSDQVKAHAETEIEPKQEYDGSTNVISTGSTLLDLAISGGRFKGGGIPAGILVEIFGPSGAGKTVLLCEIAGAVQRQGGQIMFRDPEARLNKQFARMFDLDVNSIEYDNPSTVPEVFEPVRKWEPKPENKIHGIFADSLAALSTEWEIDGKDQYGMRRAKEFSEQCRMTCRTITEKGFLMVCSNQIRQNLDAGPYGQKYKAPGGEAIGFYASLRLRCSSGIKIKGKESIKGKEHERVLGIKTEIEVFKSSVWKPFRTAPLTIIFDYGVDQTRDNLRFIKECTKDTIYRVGGRKLDKAIDNAIRIVEEEQLELQLRDEVIDLWNEIENKFTHDRIKKRRILM